MEERKTKKEWNKQVLSLGSSFCVFGFLYFPDKVRHVTSSLQTRSKLTKMRDFFFFLLHVTAYATLRTFNSPLPRTLTFKIISFCCKLNLSLQII